MSTNLREQADPWAVRILDLESIHQAVSDSIVREVREICERSQRDVPPSTQPARLLLGPPGIGKTHLFTRLRNQVLLRQNRVSLVYIRPSLGAPQTPRMLLGQLFEQLRMPLGSSTQIDLLVGAILALIGGQKHTFPNAYLFELESMTPPERARRLEEALDILVERNPSLEASADYLEALLRVPFLEKGRERRGWLSWLEGREIDAQVMEKFHIPSPLTEDRVIPALRAIATVAAPASPLLLVFDQLENLIDNSEQEPRIKAYARLIMELVDTVPGVVLVQMTVPQDWATHIAPHIEGAARSRLSVDPTSPRHTTLSLPTPEQRRQLVELWRRSLDPAPVEPAPWPFSPRRMEELCNLPGLTPRMLMLFFQEALTGGDEPADEAPSPPEKQEQARTSDLAESLAAAWRDHLADARQRIFQADEEEREVDTDDLLDGLLSLGALAPVLKLARDPKETEIHEAASGRRVVLVHSSNGRSTAAQLQRLSERKHRAPLLALRERWRPVPDGWKKAIELRHELEKKKRLRWSWIEREEAAELLALRSFLMALRSRDVHAADGTPIAQEDALAWLRALPEPPLARLCAWFQGQEEAADATPLPPVAPEAPAPPVPRSTSPLDPIMERLRIASVDRLLRELKGAARRPELLRAVEASGGRLRLLGSSIVVLREGP